MAQDPRSGIGFKAADLSLSNVPSSARPKQDATTPLRLALDTPLVTPVTTPIARLPAGAIRAIAFRVRPGQVRGFG